MAEGLTGVRDWFAAYPYACLEQKTSKSIGLRDGKAWQAVVGQLPSYLDSDGLATEGPSAGPASLVGLELAKERGWKAPVPEGTEPPEDTGSPRDSAGPAPRKGKSS